jgi:hypothetical protein
LRKEGDIEGKNPEMPFRFPALPVNIYGIAQGLKGIKRDPDRKEDIESRDRIAILHKPKNAPKAVVEKAEVFKGNEQAQIDKQAEKQPFFPVDRIIRLRHPDPDEIIYRGGSQ